MTDATEFVRYLSQKYSWIAPVFQEHREKYGNNILPHVFFGDLVRTMEESVVSNNLSEVELSKFIDDMEHYLEYGGEAIQELIVVSFLENIEKNTLLHTKVIKFFGAKLLYYYCLIWEK